jgi:hypothetical protein
MQPGRAVLEDQLEYGAGSFPVTLHAQGRDLPGYGDGFPRLQVGDSFGVTPVFVTVG